VTLTDPPVAPSGAGDRLPEDSVDPRRWIVLAVLCVNLVLIVAAVSSVNVALPKIHDALHASQTDLQWIVAAYALVFAGLLLPAGAIGDRFGRKGSLQAGLAIFIGCSLWAGQSGSVGTLVAARASMGVGAALVMPTTLSILTNVFPPGERARAIAIWAGFAGAGGAIGPLMGGWILDHFFWGSVFFINVAIGGVALVAGAFLVPSSRDPQSARLDPTGALLSIVGFGAFLFAVIEGPDQGWSSTIVLVSFAIAAIGIGAFVAYEKHRANPMLDVGLFANRRFTTGVITIAMAFFSLFGMFFTITQYFQFVRGWSPLVAGAAQVPNAVAMILVAPRSGIFIRRFGQRATVVGGLCLHGLGFTLLSLSGRHSSYLVTGLGLILIGVGSGVVFAPTTAMVMAAVPQRRAGMGSAVNDTAREVGGALGIAALGSVLVTAYRSGLSSVLRGAPRQVAESARRSVGDAVRIAKGIGGPRGTALAESARDSFVHGMASALRFGAATALLCAVVVAVLLPRDTHDHDIPADR